MIAHNMFFQIKKQIQIKKHFKSNVLVYNFCLNVCSTSSFILRAVFFKSNVLLFYKDFFFKIPDFIVVNLGIFNSQLIH